MTKWAYGEAAWKIVDRGGSITAPREVDASVTFLSRHELVKLIAAACLSAYIDGLAKAEVYKWDDRNDERG